MLLSIFVVCKCIEEKHLDHTKVNVLWLIAVEGLLKCVF